MRRIASGARRVTNSGDIAPRKHTRFESRASRSELPADDRICVDNWPAFAHWIPAWERLLDAAPEASPFHSPAWLEQAWRYPGKPIFAALLRRGDELDAGVVLCPRWETGFNVSLPVRALHCLPHMPLLDPCAAVVAKRPEVSADSIADLLETALASTHWDVLLLNRLVPRIQWLEIAAERLAQRHGWHFHQASEAQEAIIDLSGGITAYWKTRSKQLARKIRVGRSRLEALGTFELQDAVTDGMPWDACWSNIETVFADAWQRDGGLSPFQPRWRSHTYPAFSKLYADGHLFAFFAMRDGAPIAFEVWFGAGDGFYGIARGMCPEYRKLSLGNVLAAYVLERTLAHGFKQQWLGTVNDLPHFAYKHRWLTEHEGGRQLMLIRPNAWYGRLHRLLHQSPAASWLFQTLRVKPLALALFSRAQALKRRH